jgi:hypothetical protein
MSDVRSCQGQFSQLSIAVMPKVYCPVLSWLMMVSRHHTCQVGRDQIGRSHTRRNWPRRQDRVQYTVFMNVCSFSDRCVPCLWVASETSHWKRESRSRWQCFLSLKCISGYNIPGSYCGKYCHDFEWLLTGFWISIGFIDHFNTQFVFQINYSAIAYFHTFPVTAAHAESLPAFSVFTRHFLVTASNNGYSSASVSKSSLNCGSLSTANSCSN